MSQHRFKNQSIVSSRALIPLGYSIKKKRLHAQQMKATKGSTLMSFIRWQPLSVGHFLKASTNLAIRSILFAIRPSPFAFRSSLLALRSTLYALGVLFALTACRQDMHDQPKYEPLEASTFFADGRSARPLIEGTVARGNLQLDEHFYTGKINGELATELPFPATMDVLKRGQERFNIYCSPCHSKAGDGAGMIVQRGFRRPPTYHSERLRDAPIGHFFDVMTNGFGAMYSYAERVSPRDRWAIAAYIRALQLSQNATLDDVPDDVRQQLLETGK